MKERHQEGGNRLTSGLLCIPMTHFVSVMMAFGKRTADGGEARVNIFLGSMEMNADVHRDITWASQAAG